MKKRIITAILFALLIMASVFGLVACSCGGGNDNNNQQPSAESELRRAYALYASSTEAPKTYDEWLAAIKAELQGIDGVGIADVKIENGVLKVKLTDNTELDVGQVVGTGIQTAEINNEGKLVITLTDGTVKTLDKVQGVDGRGIVKIEKTDTNGNKDTYTITYTDNTTSTFYVTNGVNGTGSGGASITSVLINEEGKLVVTDSDNNQTTLGKVVGTNGVNGKSITGIAYTSTTGNVDTYTVTFDDGTTTTFEITKPKGIDHIGKTSSGNVDTYTVYYTDGTDYSFEVTNGTNGAAGRGITNVTKATTGNKTTYTLHFSDSTTYQFDVTNGTDGAQGAAGKGIKKINILSSTTEKINYRITYTDNTTFDFEVLNGTNGIDGKGIENIAKTSNSGNVDTYTITVTGGQTYTFTVTNGAKGDKGDKGETGAAGRGIVSISKTGTSGLTDTYTITYTDNTTSTFTVTNGSNGSSGSSARGIASVTQGTSGDNVTVTITYTDGSTPTVITIPKGAKGDKGDKGDTGKGITSAVINGNGHLIITYTDGTTQDAGLVVGSSSPTVAYYTEGLTYKQLSNGTYEVSNGSDKYITELIIPSTYNNKAVTAIAEEGFASCKRLQTVTIPASITAIKDSAFFGCIKIEAVYYLGSLTEWLNIDIGTEDETHVMGYYGHPNYYAHNLYINNRHIPAEVTIPSTMTQIKRFSFIGVEELKKVIIPSSVKKIGLGAFGDCSSLNQVVVSDTSSTMTIRTFAFYGCISLARIALPSTVTKEAMWSLGSGITDDFTYIDTSNNGIQYMVFMLTNTIYQEAERFFAQVKKVYGEVDPYSTRMYAIGIIGPFVLNHTTETMRNQIYDCFDMAIKYEVPIYFQMDDCTMYFTYNSDTLISFEDEENCVHTSGLTTYKHFYEDPKMCEWTSLSQPSSSQLPRWFCDWSTPGVTNPSDPEDCHVIGGFPCYNSPEFLAWYDTQVLEGVVNPIKENLIKLKNLDMEYLFAGISTGWETHIPDYSDNCVQQITAPQLLQSYEKKQYGMHAIYNLGYTNQTQLNNAMTQAGFTNQKDFIRACLYQIIHNFIEHTCKLFYDAGIGRGKIFSHTLSTSSGNGGDPLGGDNSSKRDTFVLPIWVGINDYCTPGWTMSDACAPNLNVINANLSYYSSGYQFFGNVETYCGSLGDNEAECRSILTAYMGGKSKVMVFFGYEHTADLRETLGFPRNKTHYVNKVIIEWFNGTFLPGYVLPIPATTPFESKVVCAYNSTAAWSFADHYYNDGSVHPIQTGSNGIKYSFSFVNHSAVGPANQNYTIELLFGPAEGSSVPVKWSDYWTGVSAGQGFMKIRFWANYDGNVFNLYALPIQFGAETAYGGTDWAQFYMGGTNSGGTISFDVVMQKSGSGYTLTVGGKDMTGYLSAAGGSKFMGSTGLTNVAVQVKTPTQCDVAITSLVAL